jgi:flavin-dependent dehydrogenase
MKDLYSRNAQNPNLSLKNGSHVAVMGGGPAGSLFSYFLLVMAERVGIDIHVDIYEPRDFSMKAPQGCNYCAGVISESLVQNLAVEGINLPPTVVQRAIDSYVMHTDVGKLRIEPPSQERRIGVVFRGAGPRGTEEFKWQSFDGYLLSMAQDKGARVINYRITDVQRVDGRLSIYSKVRAPQSYDLLAVTSGVNSAALKIFEKRDFDYKPPKTTKAAIREYYLGADMIEKYLGHSLHVFLLDIPRLSFGMIVPKGDYVTACILGTDTDEALVETFLKSSEVRRCFPPGWDCDQPACHCFPRITVQGAMRPYADRVVFIGDCGVSRLYKDGIGAAYRAAKAAAVTAIFEGISANDFQRQYNPLCRALETDNNFGKVIFIVTHIIQRTRFSRRAVLRMASREQQKGASSPRMSSVLWDTFTGSAPYRDIFLRTLHPAFMSGLTWNLAATLFNGSPKN